MLLANHEMTSICLGIAKVQCQKFNIIGYFFLSLICPCMVCLKEKYAKKNKSKKNKNALYMIANMSSRRCWSYRIYLEGASPYQTVMIVCVS